LSDFDQSLIKPSRDLQSSCLDLEECFDICAGKRDFSAGEPQVCECVCERESACVGVCVFYFYDLFHIGECLLISLTEEFPINHFSIMAALLNSAHTHPFTELLICILMRKGRGLIKI